MSDCRHQDPPSEENQKWLAATASAEPKARHLDWEFRVMVMKLLLLFLRHMSVVRDKEYREAEQLITDIEASIHQSAEGEKV